MKLRLLSVNVRQPAPIGIRAGETIISAIAKTPVSAERVRIGVTNIEGDAQADLTVHGGADKAIYAYPQDHWSWWEGDHGLHCRPATFGENLTIRGADESAVAIGDRFRWGSALLEVSEPRAPCYKFAMHTGREDAPQLMTLSARCGWYLRVIEEGDAPIRDGELERIHASDGPSVRDAFVAALHPRVLRELCLRVHDAPALAASWRSAIARRLAKSRE
jgi:MOSC domain-containing protein YiiM